MEDQIRKAIQAQNTGIADNIIKGTYKNNAENKRKGRVGQQYGISDEGAKDLFKEIDLEKEGDAGKLKAHQELVSTKRINKMKEARNKMKDGRSKTIKTLEIAVLTREHDREFGSELSNTTPYVGITGKSIPQPNSEVRGLLEKLFGNEKVGANHMFFEMGSEIKRTIQDPEVKKKISESAVYKVLKMDRDTTGMPGTQDKYQVQIFTMDGKLVASAGSHPTRDGGHDYKLDFAR